jgi:tetratricopeptide (TPR) repeat protein
MFLTSGIAYLAQGARIEAGTNFRKALELNPDMPEAHVGLAKVYRLTGDFDDALNELNLALGKLEGIAGYSEAFQQLLAEIHFEAGLTFEQKGEVLQAISSYEKVVEMIPSSGRANRRLAEVLFVTGQYDRSLEFAEKAAELGNPVESALFREITARAGQSP